MAQASLLQAEACAAAVVRPAEELVPSQPLRDERIQSELAPRASAAPRADARCGQAVQRADDLLPVDCSAKVAPQADDSVAPAQRERDAPRLPVEWPVDSSVDSPALPRAGQVAQHLAE